MDFADIIATDTVVDLYCGTGTITLLMSKKAKKAIGVLNCLPKITLVFSP